MGILDDLAMGLNFKDKDDDYYERTAANIEKNDGPAAASNYKSSVANDTNVFTSNTTQQQNTADSWSNPDNDDVVTWDSDGTTTVTNTSTGTTYKPEGTIEDLQSGSAGTGQMPTGDGLLSSQLVNEGVAFLTNTGGAEDTVAVVDGT